MRLYTRNSRSITAPALSNGTDDDDDDDDDEPDILI